MRIWISNAANCQKRDYPTATLGPPKADNLIYSVEELEKEGIVGVYVEEEYAAKCVLTIRNFKSNLKGL